MDRRVYEVARAIVLGRGSKLLAPQEVWDEEVRRYENLVGQDQGSALGWADVSDAIKDAESALKAIDRLNWEDRPVAARHGWDGHGWLYIDDGSGSDWLERHKDAEPLYAWPCAAIAQMKRALRWYEEQVSGCRKITVEGDAARTALASDGGALARKALDPFK